MREENRYIIRVLCFDGLISYTTFLILLSFLSISFYSCKDNPVSNKQNPVKKYIWNIDSVSGYQFDNICVVDSDNIFLSSRNEMIYFNGDTYTIIDNDPNFKSNIIQGMDKSNLFIGGGTPGVYMGDPVLKIFTNFIINSYVIMADSGSTIKDILPVGINQCWISSSEKWKIYLFNNGVFNSYSLDSGDCRGVFYLDKFNNLFVFPEKVIGNGVYLVSYYKLINEKFIKLGFDTVTQNTDKLDLMKRCGNDFLRSGLTSIYYFNGSNWIKKCNTLNFLPLTISGENMNNILCWSPNIIDYKLFSYDGNNWNQENTGLNFINTNIHIYGQDYKNDIAYYTLYDFNNNYSFILKGKIK